MSEISIRQAAKADAPVILGLLRELAAFEKLEHIFTLNESLILRDMLGDDPAAQCEIAMMDGQPAGLAVWFWLYGSFRGRRGLYIEDLYVRPQFRGQGAGMALLAHLARQGAQAGAGWMEWKVLDWNSRARDFYRSIGARPVENWRTYRLEGKAMRRLDG